MTTTAYTITPVPVHSTETEWEFRATAVSESPTDLPAPWYTVVVRNADQGSRRRYAVWAGSPLKAGTMLRRSAMSVHSIAHQEVVAAVKAYLASA